uniref:Small RNA 2'-O-methyltransferase n=1 Tax=Culicoides sonorensis TaxID=179676 RepID=A0A336MDH8_CULSO
MSFNLKIDLDFIPTCYYKEGNIKFDPPLYTQRYCFVSKVLEHEAFKDKIKKVIDFGCSELKFFNTIRYNLPGIEHVLEIDIDEAVLKQHAHSVKPMITEFIKQRPAPLKVQVYKGSIATKHECLLNTDALIAIELIEHLTSDVLSELPNVVFDYMKPKLAIFTTPNSEANVLFPEMEGFRHWDHKFEWTRAEFEKWAYDICEKFTDYSVEFYQIGVGPPEKNDLNFGGISQCAIFLCKEFVNDVINCKYPTQNLDPVSVGSEQVTSEQNQAALDEENDEIVIEQEINGDELEQGVSDESEIEENIENLEVISNNESDLSGYASDNEYKLIFEVDYPFTKDDRTEHQKILDEAKYQISRLSRVDRYIDDENDVSLIPLDVVFDFVFPEAKTIDQLRHVLITEGFKLNENNFIEISNDEEESDDGLDESDNYSYDEGSNEIADFEQNDQIQVDENWSDD